MFLLHFHLLFSHFHYFYVEERVDIKRSRDKILVITKIIFTVQTFNLLNIYFPFPLVTLNFQPWNMISREVLIFFLNFIRLQGISCLIHVPMLEMIQELLLAKKFKLVCTAKSRWIKGKWHWCCMLQICLSLLPLQQTQNSTCFFFFNKFKDSLPFVIYLVDLCYSDWGKIKPSSCSNLHFF